MTFEIRPASASDVGDIASLHVLGWQTSYRNILPDSLLDSLDVSQRARLWAEWLGEPDVHTLIASGSTGVVGFVRLSPARPIEAPPPRAAEVTHLYVHPEGQGSGVGWALLQSAIHVARESRYRTVVLWVLEANASARRFYGKFGFLLEGARRTDPAFLGNDAAEIRYLLTL